MVQVLGQGVPDGSEVRRYGSSVEESCVRSVDIRSSRFGGLFHLHGMLNALYKLHPMDHSRGRDADI